MKIIEIDEPQVDSKSKKELTGGQKFGLFGEW